MVLTALQPVDWFGGSPLCYLKQKFSACSFLPARFCSASAKCATLPARVTQKKGPRIWLSDHDYDEKTIDAVVKGQKLSPALVDELFKEGNENIHFMVGSNRHLSEEQIDLYLKVEDDFGRSGVATNVSLNRRQMLVVMKDPSHTVYSKLAGNPAVPSDILLRLKKERKLDLLWFAQNPKIPRVLRKEILASDNEPAKEGLKATKQIEAYKKKNSE